MKEEYINRLYYLAKLKNYKGTRDEFVEKLQTDDSYFNYALYMARNDKVKYKGTDEEFSIAIGRTKPQSTQSETAATEETAKVEKPVVKEEVKLVAEEPVIEEPIVEEKPAIQVKEVEAPKEEVVKKEIPAEALNQNIIPITDKTEIKAVETPSDKLVVKSEKKEEVKEQPKPEEKPQMEVKDVTEKKSEMVIKSENKENTNQQSQTFSKPIIINGVKFDDDMNLMRNFRPSEFEEYKELSKLAKPVDKSLDEIAQSFVQNYESIQLDRNISLNFPDPPNAKKKSAVTQNTENIFEDKIGNKNVYTYYDDKNKKWYVYNKEKNDNNWNEVTSPQIKTILNSKYKNSSGEIDKSKIFKINEEEADKIIKIKEYYYYNKYLPTLIENWDNLKENQKDSIKKDLNFLLMKRLSRDMYHQEKYKKEIKDTKERIKRNENIEEIDMILLKSGNPDERYDKFWEYVVEKTGAGDEEVKSLIKKYKKEVKEQPKPEEKPQMEVKDVTKEESETPKKEEPKGIPSYDDLGINPEKEPGSFLGKSFDKSAIKKYDNKYEKLSPSELVSKGVFKNIANIKLERNKTLRYPDPKGIVFEKTKIGDKTIYPSYDEKNNKWYFHEEGSDKNNWTEVTSGVMKTMLNSKYKKWETDVQGENGRFTKIDESKKDYIDNKDREQIFRLKESILMNKYAPYILKNYDKLSEEEKLKLNEDINYGTFSISPSGGYQFMLNKFLGEDDPSLKFWLDFNDKFLNNNAISEKNPEAKPILNDIKENEKKNYKSDELIKDINDKKIKFLKSTLGDVLYDEKNDLFYYSLGVDRRVAASSDFGEDREFYNFTKIPKGTPAYDKIKNSLSKYNN